MRRVIVISGAGTGVESGIRTFRTDESSGKAMWEEYDIDEVCNIQAFNSEFYQKTHDFYNKRRVELKGVEPNLFHLRVAEWYARYPGQVHNITTNVDDLLERAGVPDSTILHVHGYLPEVITQDQEGAPKLIKNVGYAEIDTRDYHWCKPNVVFFGEMAPNYSEMYNILDNLTANDMVIVVGCSNTVINFNWELFPAVRRGTKMLVVNPATPYHEVESYQENGALVYRAGAVETFGNKNFINTVEKFLEG